MILPREIAYLTREVDRHADTILQQHLNYQTTNGQVSLKATLERNKLKPSKKMSEPCLSSSQ